MEMNTMILSGGLALLGLVIGYLIATLFVKGGKKTFARRK